MLPEPLHPAIVHFPIVLAVLAPLCAIAVFAAIRAGWLPQRSWVAVIVLQVAVTLSAWVAVETGEHEEDRVERVVAERHIEAHEENAERFLVISGLVIPLAIAGGWLAGTLGTATRVATIVMSLAALAAAGATGHTGGELVYAHGAAAAYVQPDADGPGPAGDHDDD